MGILSLLEKTGLSEKEARIFIVAVELGVATAYEIAKKAKVKRTTAYAVLDALVDKKLVGVLKKNGKKMYSSVNHGALVERGKEKKQEAENFENHSEL